MKKIIFAFIIFSTSTTFASPLCQYLEAQMMATVRTITPISEKKCRVTFSWEGRWIYNHSYSCPLDIDEVSSFGAETTYCDYKVGDEISGVVLRPTEGTPQDIILY